MYRQLKKFTQLLWREEDGVAATEYAVLIAVILVACIAAVLSTGNVQKAIWIDNSQTISDKLGN